MNYKTNKWYPFDIKKQAKQILPPEKKRVLLYYPAISEYGISPCYCVGYFKHPAGVKNEILCIHPGVERKRQQPEAWNDCLPELVLPYKAVKG